MEKTADNWSLFGYDLRRPLRAWRTAWSEAVGWPVFRRLEPALPVRLRRLDGQTTVQAGTTGIPLRRAPTRLRHEALQVPDDLVLVQDLRLPAMSRGELEQAVALQADRNAPFAPERVVCGWRVVARRGGRVDIRLALADRPRLQAWLDERAGQSAPDGLAEAWYLDADGLPILLRGFGESVRLRREGQMLRLNLAAVALVLLAPIILLGVLYFQQWQLSGEVQARYERLTEQVQPLVALRAQHGELLSQVRALDELAGGTPDLATILERLSAVLPDSVMITRLEMNGARLRLSGLADDAPGVVQRLSALPGTHDVRTTSPIRRQDGTDREVFVIELDLTEDFRA